MVRVPEHKIVYGNELADRQGNNCPTVGPASQGHHAAWDGRPHRHPASAADALHVLPDEHREADIGRLI